MRRYLARVAVALALAWEAWRMVLVTILGGYRWQVRQEGERNVQYWYFVTRRGAKHFAQRLPEAQGLAYVSRV